MAEAPQLPAGGFPASLFYFLGVKPFRALAEPTKPVVKTRLFLTRHLARDPSVTLKRQADRAKINSGDKEAKKCPNLFNSLTAEIWVWVNTA